MGEEQSRPVSLAGVQKDRRHIQPTGKRGGRIAVAVLIMVAVLGLAANPAGSAASQDPPAKKDAAAKADAPPGSAPDAPTQEPDSAAAEALSVRYRFHERYSTTEDPNHPERITQYRVALRETQKFEREKQQGAPERGQFSRQTIYTEAAAQVSKQGEAICAVRRYDKFQLKPIATARPAKVPFFEGLTIFYKLQPGQRPLILNLTDDRPLREFEYSQLTKQVILPQLTALLPVVPRRVRDTWPISPKAAQCLVGELPDDDDFELTGTLLEVHRASGTPTLTAVIGISGKMNLTHGLSSLNARLHCVFKPTEAVPPPSRSDAAPKSADRGRSRSDEGIVDARGYIARVLMAWTATNVLPNDDGRLKQTRTYELELERRLAPASEAIPGGANAPVAIPETLPAPTEANSWLLYEDPMGKYHLLHPQNLELSPRMSDPNVLELVEQNHGKGKDVFILRLAPGAADPPTDRKFSDVNQFQQEIDADWAKMKVDTVRGAAGWLPQAEGSEWKVFRKELGVIAAGGEEQGKAVERIYCDYYLILTKDNKCFHVQSMTVRDDHLIFRKQTENIINNFHFGKWDAQPKAPAATPAPSLTPPGG
jgi:hypothetical protein